MRVLIADDCRLSLVTLAGMLKPYGVDTVLVTNAVDALVELEKGGIDFAFIDWMMPGYTGRYVLDQARLKGDTTPLYLYTTLNITGDYKRGFAGVLQKPPDGHTVKSIVQKYTKAHD